VVALFFDTHGMLAKLTQNNTPYLSRWCHRAWSCPFHPYSQTYCILLILLFFPVKTTMINHVLIVFLPLLSPLIPS
jgi:hypothetical protein